MKVILKEDFFYNGYLIIKEGEKVEVTESKEKDFYDLPINEKIKSRCPLFETKDQLYLHKYRVIVEDPEESLEEHEGKYFIWSGDYLGNAMMWWRENSAGYTADLSKAGKYSKEDAERICKNTDSAKAFLCNRILINKDAIKTIVDANYVNTSNPDISYVEKEKDKGDEKTDI